MSIKKTTSYAKAGTEKALCCPSCNEPTSELVAGVCPRCKRNFEQQHTKKLEVNWTGSDFHYGMTLPIHDLTPIMDDDDARTSDKRKSFEEASDFFKRGFRVLVQYKGTQTLGLYSLCLAIGWGELIECETAVDVAKKLFGNPKKKAAVTKCVKMFQDALGIEPMPGQRSQIGRTEMAKSRKKQLK